MNKLFAWVKQNKLTTILAITLLYFVSQNTLPQFMNISSSQSPMRFQDTRESLGVSKIANTTDSYMMPSSIQNVAPSTGSDRLVISNTSLSLVTSTVDQSIKKIESIATQAGGYMVNSNIHVPEGAASGDITIRVPSVKSAEVLEQIKQTGTKVVSENVSGRDVTDQYVDLDARLQSLNTTKGKFEAILDQATSIPQILEVTRELQNIQTQIDNLKGQQLYLTKSAELTKITTHLSTDELALPYAPDKAWRPEVIVKQAIRSLLGTIQSIGSLGIWLIIYTPIWGTMIAIYLIVKKRRHSKDLQ